MVGWGAYTEGVRGNGRPVENLAGKGTPGPQYALDRREINYERGKRGNRRRWGEGNCCISLSIGGEKVARAQQNYSSLRNQTFRFVCSHKEVARLRNNTGRFGSPFGC